MLVRLPRCATWREAAGRRAAAAWSGRRGLKSGQWIQRDLGFETSLVHAGVDPEPRTGAVLTPIFQSTTYIQDSVDEYLEKGFSYSRTGNPTVNTLEAKIAALEGGAGAACFGTGMAATIALISACLKSGDHCVITECSYGGTNRACREMFAALGISFDFVDFTDVKTVEVTRTHSYLLLLHLTSTLYCVAQAHIKPNLTP